MTTWMDRLGAWADREQAKLDAQRAALKQPGRDLAYCTHCQRNVRPVRRAKASRLLLTGGVGFLLTRPTACPICKAEGLEQAR